MQQRRWWLGLRLLTGSHVRADAAPAPAERQPVGDGRHQLSPSELKVIRGWVRIARPAAPLRGNIFALKPSGAPGVNRRGSRPPNNKGR